MFQYSPLSRRSCNVRFQQGNQVTHDVSVLTPEPKVVQHTSDAHASLVSAEEVSVLTPEPKVVQPRRPARNGKSSSVSVLTPEPKVVQLRIRLIPGRHH